MPGSTEISVTDAPFPIPVTPNPAIVVGYDPLISMAVSTILSSHRTARSPIEPNRRIWNRTKLNRSPPHPEPSPPHPLPLPPPTCPSPPTSHLPLPSHLPPTPHPSLPPLTSNLPLSHSHLPPPSEVEGGGRWEVGWEEGGGRCVNRTVPTDTSSKETAGNANRTEPNRNTHTLRP